MPAKAPYDITLPSAKKPGYGRLVAVTVDGESRELWFQNGKTIRMVRIQAKKGSADAPFTVTSRRKAAKALAKAAKAGARAGGGVQP